MTVLRKKPFFSMIIIILGSLLVLVPVYWMVATSFKTTPETFENPLTLIPRHPTLQAYKNIITSYSFGTFFSNSLIVVIGATLLTLFISTFAGFGVSRFNFKGRAAFLGFILATQMFPSVIMLVPYFRILKLYGLINTHMGLIIVYISFQTPLCTWLMYSHFETISKDLDAAASIDGLGQFGIFFRIIFPLSLPGIAATAIYSFINSWNEFQFALVLTTSDKMKTLTVGIGQMIEDTKVNWNEMMAANLLASVLLILVFLFCQNFFFAGMTSGSIKE
ncbi:ABC transporter, permease protein [Treponema socranskii subsp. socranskii VPI DR56BR1116 = ATCC 35536]|uniref:ABC transporter, permease protein n=1 Tax=Treponema socranskii subsp. socranskii VPI DR56BR1116 = ATCC 35536 TaxID=1125725 RepID=U2MY64_TRESO|nr:carbohydrate ABC transporter permease [Treponema socranskii]ERF60198.1 ABC transporter, permease protein [Treponema socranskii subsp. socranskii VPI DR56BR1116 = ATCC 35536]ERK04149.1 ABC transporter, permease protein [Treponema socranskii subsp. socranskii VPI DR56BR1116 = ATCC 35536]